MYDFMSMAPNAAETTSGRCTFRKMKMTQLKTFRGRQKRSNRNALSKSGSSLFTGDVIHFHPANFKNAESYEWKLIKRMTSDQVSIDEVPSGFRSLPLAIPELLIFVLKIVQKLRVPIT